MTKKAKDRAAGKKPRSKLAAPRKMYKLQLYITGQTTRSAASVRNLRHVCDQFLNGKFELQVIDIYQQPELAKEAQIIAAPTLVKRLPLPLRRLVGDLSNEERVIIGLDLAIAQNQHKE